MSKKKFIEEQSNFLIKEKLSEGLSFQDTISFFKSFIPKNNIEKRIIQRSICLLGGYLCIEKGKFKNDKLINLLTYLKK